MSTVKQQLVEVIASLPDNCTLDDFRYRLYVRQKAEEGLRAIEEGRVHTHEEAVEIVKSWRKSSGPPIEDLARTFDYIARRSQLADRATRVCLEILASAKERLSQFPDAGSPVDELKEIGARELLKHAHRIIYVHRGHACYVLQCIHSSRELARHLDPTRWLALPQIDEA